MTITHERTDAMPVSLAFLRHRRVAAGLDKPFPTPGPWTGLRLGQMLRVGLPCRLAEGAHRLAHVAPWGAAPQQTLRRGGHQQVGPRAGTAERLARGRDALGVVEPGAAGALHQTRRRIAARPPPTPRVDPTPVSASVTPDGRGPRGPSQADRPDRPPLQSPRSPLAPRGLPLPSAAGAGHTAAEPLYPKSPQRTTGVSPWVNARN
jgi:hypothetical protein